MNRIFSNPVPPQSRLSMAVGRACRQYVAGGHAELVEHAERQINQAKAICQVSDAMSKRLIHEHPNAERGLSRLLDDIYAADDHVPSGIAHQMVIGAAREQRRQQKLAGIRAARQRRLEAERHAKHLASLTPIPGDDCPTQRVIDLQARHAIKEWDGGL